MSGLGDGNLFKIIRDAAIEENCAFNELSVLSRGRDPYRFDTENGHRDGSWVAEQLKRLVPDGRPIHWRGFFYVLVAKGNVKKPDGTIFRNTGEDYLWLKAAALPAQWLKKVPFDRIIDNRSDEPVIHRFDPTRSEPQTFVMAGSVFVELPAYVSLKPQAVLAGSIAEPQPYALAIFGEKSSLADVLDPIAERYGADLYLGTGEISNTLAYKMAKDAAEDGRPLVIFTCTDCDPAGLQMPVSIGRKMQALRDLCFPDLDFELHPVALTVGQVKKLRLPSTPLKATERRADKWREAFGVEQTEIDALAALNPEALTEIVTKALAPFFDHTLVDRTWEATFAWQENASTELAKKIDPDAVAKLEERTRAAFKDFRAKINAINAEAEALAKAKIKFPKVPEIKAFPDGAPRSDTALISTTDMTWAEQTWSLIARKSYGGDEP